MNLKAAVSHLRALPDPPSELEKLFREHYDRVFRTAFKITGSASDAEDVLQTVFLRLALSKNYDLSPNPSGYLIRAAINASLDLVKRRNRSVSIEDIENEPVESPILGPEAQQISRQLRDALRQSIGALGRTASEIFILRFFEGYDNREIAQILGTSQMVVAVLLHRARSRVKKELGKILEDRHEAN